MDALLPSLRSPADVLAAVPYLLGFRPTDSLVVMGVRDTRVIFQARADLPPADDAPSLAAQLTEVLSRQRVTGALIVGFGPAALVTPAVLAMRTAVDAKAIEVVEALRATGGRYWSYLCADVRCCPPDGTAYDIGTTAVAASATVAGLNPAASRTELAARYASVRGPARLAMRAAVRRADVRLRHLIDGTAPIRPAADRPISGRSGSDRSGPDRSDSEGAGSDRSDSDRSDSDRSGSEGAGSKRPGSEGAVSERTAVKDAVVEQVASDRAVVEGAVSDRAVSDPAASDRVDSHRHSDRSVSERAASDRVAVAGREAVDRAILGLTPAVPIDDDDLAWLALLLVNPFVRDYAWARVGHDVPGHVELWTQVVRRVDPELAAAPATLLAYAAWRNGDGPVAAIALDRAVAADPNYAMAHLLNEMIGRGIAPGDWLDDIADDAMPTNADRRRLRHKPSRRRRRAAG